MNRRTFLASAGIAGGLAGLLAGCGIFTITKTNGVTTVTINVAKIDQYGNALASFTASVADVPGIGAYLVPVKAIENVVLQDVAAFDAAANGQTVLTFDANSIPASINSILADGKILLTTIGKALPQSAIVGTVLEAFNAVQTIVMVIEALLPVDTKLAAAAAPRPFPMTEGRALAVLAR
jgi:hypothetical protein